MGCNQGTCDAVLRALHPRRSESLVVVLVDGMDAQDHNPLFDWMR